MIWKQVGKLGQKPGTRAPGMQILNLMVTINLHTKIFPYYSYVISF